MDSCDVPKKINRHVLKALITVLESGLRFTEVLEYVRLCNKKLKPVPNIKQVVLKSLENFQRIGLIKRDRSSRYKITNLVFPKSNSTGRVSKRVSLETPRQSVSLDPNARRRSNLSNENNSVKSSRKQFRSQKNISNRDGRKAHLPNVRKKNIETVRFSTDGPLFAGNIVSAPPFNEDVAMTAIDQKDHDYDDDESVKAISDEESVKALSDEESVKALSDEESDEPDKIMAPDEDKTPEPTTENQKNNENENSAETNTTVASTVENFDRLNFSYRPYLN